MRIANWMQTHIHTVKPHDSIAAAREKMALHRVNQLPVVVNDRLIGIVTDRDLRDAFPSVLEMARDVDRRHDAALERITVETVMTADVLTLGPDDTMVEAARLMRRERVGALPIVQDGRLVGVLARSDILAAFVGLSEVTEPTKKTLHPQV